MVKITVVGSESFLAQNFIKYLNQRDNLQQCNGSKSTFSLFCYDYVDKSDTENYQKIDFSSAESIRLINYDVDYFLIFIGKTGTVNGFHEYESFIQVNEIYLLNILSCYAKQDKRPLIIYPSSRLLFAAADTKVSESSKWDLRSVYAVTKASAENYLKIYERTYGIRYVILRMCTPYGSLIESAGNYGTFEIFYNQAKYKRKISIFGDGTQKKTYTRMEDICEAFLKLIEAENIKHHSYNLGGQALSMNDMAKCIATELGAGIEHVPWPEEYEMVDGGSVIFDSSRFDHEFDMTYHQVMKEM